MGDQRSSFGKVFARDVKGEFYGSSGGVPGELRKMFKTRTRRVCMGLVAGLMVMPSAGALAQEWRRGEYEYFKEPHRFGPHCEYRIGARGSAPIKFFGGGHEVRKAELRSIGDWEFEAGRLFGPRYAHWDLAAAKRVRCETRGLEFVCTAVAHPCRPH